MKNNDNDILLWILIMIFLMSVVGCKPEPQFYIDGKPCFLRKGKCLKEELTVNYHGPLLTNECVEWKMDTVEIGEDGWPK